MNCQLRRDDERGDNTTEGKVAFDEEEAGNVG